MLAVLALALVPTVSRALAHAQGQSAWVEVCSQQGSVWVAADGSSTDGNPDGATLHTLEHCALCGLAAAALPLPPTEFAWVLPLTAATLVPTLFLQAPRPQFVWVQSQPRAPPVRS